MPVPQANKVWLAIQEPQARPDQWAHRARKVQAGRPAHKAIWDRRDLKVRLAPQVSGCQDRRENKGLRDLLARLDQLDPSIQP